MKLLAVAIIAFALVGCARFHQADHSVDPHDAGLEGHIPDLPDAALECSPYVFMGCSFAHPQWFWNGRDCEALFECGGRGDPTRRSCLASHAACVPGLDLEARTFVFLDMRRACIASGGPAWSFTFIPSEDAQLSRLDGVAGGLREGLEAPSAEVRVQVLGALDPFHDPVAFEVGDADLSVELCELGACAEATQGTFSFETGGAGLGSTAIDVRFGLEPVAVDLGGSWISYAAGLEVACWP